MNRFIKRIIVFIVLPLLTIAISYEYLARRIPNVYSYKNEWLSKNASSVKILNLGSSHGYFGIDPSFFSSSAFNAAHESQDLKYDHFVLTKFLDEMNSLKVLILPVSYRSFVEPSLENKKEYWRVKYYCIYYKCPYHRCELLYNSEFYNDLYFHDLRIVDMIKSTFGEISYINCDSLGKGIRNVYEHRESDWWEESGKIRANYHTYAIDTAAIRKNMGYATEIVRECAQKNIFVLLVTTPTYQTYRDNLNQNQLEIMLNCCDYFQSNYDNVCYLNLLADERFSIADYSDADHLNEIGAKKLTLILQQAIDSLKLCD